MVKTVDFVIKLNKTVFSKKHSYNYRLFVKLKKKTVF